MVWFDLIGDECPFLHGIPVENPRNRHRSCSEAELSESCGSEDAAELPIRFGRSGKGCGGGVGGQGSSTGCRKKFQFDLEADFPSLMSQAAKPSTIAGELKATTTTRPVVSQSRPIAITQGFAPADHTSTTTTAGSSLENGACGDPAPALKRRRKRFPCQRATAFVQVHFYYPTFSRICNSF